MAKTTNEENDIGEAVCEKSDSTAKKRSQMRRSRSKSKSRSKSLDTKPLQCCKDAVVVKPVAPRTDVNPLAFEGFSDDSPISPDFWSGGPQPPPNIAVLSEDGDGRSVHRLSRRERDQRCSGTDRLSAVGSSLESLLSASQYNNINSERKPTPSTVALPARSTYLTVPSTSNSPCHSPSSAIPVEQLCRKCFRRSRSVAVRDFGDRLSQLEDTMRQQTRLIDNMAKHDDQFNDELTWLRQRNAQLDSQLANANAATATDHMATQRKSSHVCTIL